MPFGYVCISPLDHVPFGYVCISPLDHVLLLLDAVSFVHDVALVFDMVHLILLAVEVLQDAWISAVVSHAGPELLKRQEAESLFVGSFCHAVS